MRRPQESKDIVISLQDVRDEYIRVLGNSTNPLQKARDLVDDLFEIDLTTYSSMHSLDSILYNSLSVSRLDENISLHPEQIKIIQKIKQNDALIVSAPTSFGKTFCVFEYIAQYEPLNVVLIVPTLALVEEYLKRIVKKYKDFFKSYKIHTHIDENDAYDFGQRNIFILTHDRVVKESVWSSIKQIDFLVIDEVYKLETDLQNDRVLVLNMAYYYLSKIAKKYVLLAPFISGIENAHVLEKMPVLHNTNYSPVVNEVEVIEIPSHKTRYAECKKLLSGFDASEKILIYFPTVIGLYKYINDYLADEPVINITDVNVQNFLKWAKDDIHDDWCVIKAMERGYLIHNGQIPLCTRMFQLDSFERQSGYNRLLCTSTLLEGVNTTAKSIIITKPSRDSSKNNNSRDFTAFDFFNLVGRTGRLNQHFIGKAYYLKAPSDPFYVKKDAVKSIKFEITDESKDVDIQKGDIDKHNDVIEFLRCLGISIDEYHSNIGSRLRFETVKKIYNNFLVNKEELIALLYEYVENPAKGRLYLVKLLYKIIQTNYNGGDNFNAYILNQLLNMRRYKIKKIVNETKFYYEAIPIDIIISTTIKMKSSYIENEFYSRVLLIRYFIDLKLINKKVLDVLDEKIIKNIEYLYFANSQQRKLLVDIGIYDYDVEKIISVIGDDFKDAFELKERLKQNSTGLNKISYISKYVIQSLL